MTAQLIKTQFQNWVNNWVLIFWKCLFNWGKYLDLESQYPGKEMEWRLKKIRTYILEFSSCCKDLDRDWNEFWCGLRFGSGMELVGDWDCDWMGIRMLIGMGNELGLFMGSDVLEYFNID